MDAMKLLGGLMKNKSLASGLGGNLLGGLMGGGSDEKSGVSGLMGMLGGGGGAGALSGVMGMLGGGGGGGAMSKVMGLLGGGNEEAAPEPVQQAAAAVAPREAQDQAVLMIRAMVNAAKSDGRVDETEQKNIISKLGEISPEEAEFLRTEFQRPLDVQQFAGSIPKGMEQQIYAISLTSINLDTQNEAQYLANLGQGLHMDPQTCNQIHEQLGAPVIFS